GRIFNDIPSAIGFTCLVAFIYGSLPLLQGIGGIIKKGLLFTGSISYELYLTHMLVFSLLAYFLSSGNINKLPLSGRLLAIPLAFLTASLFRFLFRRVQSLKRDANHKA
ncbi:MAG: hypothetical protein ABFR63_05240, partial [Thermodesulfobacteriota bacterium]